MADTLTVQGLILHDNWPGTPTPPPFPVVNMEAAAIGHNIVAPMWKLGTKWELYCKGDAASVGVAYNIGWSTFIYLKAAPDIETATAGAATVLCVPDATLGAGAAANLLYVVVADISNTTHENSGLVVMCLSAPTNSYYGWYWCGGVCPVEYCPSLTTASTVITDGSVVASCEVSTIIDSDTVGLRAQATNSQTPGVGYALYVDGT